ncbi:MAG: cyclic lactone autoinducer peptide [Oscillospiraceae bacterium]
MKRLIYKLQKIALAALMSTSFIFALTNINVTCTAWSYQPKPPKALEQYKHFGND